MRYPKKYSPSEVPDEIRPGDLIWWNEGACVGFVEEVMETPLQFERRGLDQPSIAVSNLHPIEANAKKHKQVVGSPFCGATVVYSWRDLEDEGVGLLSEHERSELSWAIAEAKLMVPAHHRVRPLCVTALLDPKQGKEDWQFFFVDRGGRVVESVALPFRANTRTPRPCECDRSAD